MRMKNIVTFWIVFIMLAGMHGYAQSQPDAKQVKNDMVKLIEKIGDKDAAIREKAVWALGDTMSADAVEALTKSLSDVEWRVRMAAAVGLGKIGDRKAAPKLLIATGDAESVVRTAAVQALGHIGDPETVEPLVKMLSDEGSPRPSVVWALGEIRDIRAVEPLVKTLGDRDPGVRSGAAEALGKIKDQRGVEPLVKALRDRKEEVRQNAASALGKHMNTDAVEPLIKLLADKNPEVRAIAAIALAKLRDNKGLSAVNDAFQKEEDVSVRRAMDAALGSPDAMQSLIDDLKGHRWQKAEFYLENMGELALATLKTTLATEKNQQAKELLERIIVKVSRE